MINHVGRDIDVDDSIEFENCIDQFFEQSNDFFHIFLVLKIDFEIDRVETRDAHVEIVDIVCLVFALVDMLILFALDLSLSLSLASLKNSFELLSIIAFLE